jgi:hypothetical protein
VAGVWPTWNTTASTNLITISTTTGIWQNWNTTASTATTFSIWPAWNGYCAQTPLIVTQDPWPSWNIQITTSSNAALGTPERIEANRRMLEEAAAERSRIRARARSKALALLMSFLDDEQQRTYREMGWFDITGSRGRRWRIEARGQAGNVLLLPSDAAAREADSFCCHPPGGLPDADAHLAQMLHLVTDEDDFERTANRAGRRHLRPVA